MSAHYSKFALNTYLSTPYFQSQLPYDYPIYLVLQSCRAFRRLSPNLKQLAGLAKQWAARYPETYGKEIDQYYDQAGFELNPTTGRRLSDAEIDAEWVGYERIPVDDIPIPDGGFPDPATWEEMELELIDDDGPTDEQLTSDVLSRGLDRVAKDYKLSKASLIQRVGKAAQQTYLDSIKPKVGDVDTEGNEIIAIATGKNFRKE